MSTIKEREEAMRMLLAEVSPWSVFRVAPDSRTGLGVSVTVRSGDRPAIMARRLSALRLLGPDAPVACDAHVNSGGYLPDVCDRIPVGWALLGHTCGRAS
jgi:hypothetical protein